MALPVLLYHSVSAMEPAHRGLGVPPDLLREQLRALVADGYALVGLTEALRHAGAGRDGERVAALTFDDGYADFLDGLDVLREVGATATLYVNPGHVGTSMAGRPLLTWPQIRAVAAAGIEVGNHSLIHHRLDRVPPTVLDRELRESTDRLAAEVGVPVRSFAYPGGHHSARVRERVAGYGYDNACVVGYRPHRPPGRRFAVPRLHVGPDHDGAATVALARTGAPVLAPLVPIVRRAARPAWRLARRLVRT